MSDSDEELVKKEEERLARLQQRKAGANKYANAVNAAKPAPKSPTTGPQSKMPATPPPSAPIPPSPAVTTPKPPAEPSFIEIDPVKAKEEFEAKQKQFMNPSQKARFDVLAEITPKIKKDDGQISPRPGGLSPRPTEKVSPRPKSPRGKSPAPAEKVSVPVEKVSPKPKSPRGKSPAPTEKEPEPAPESPKKANNFADLKNQFGKTVETKPEIETAAPKKGTKWTKPPASPATPEPEKPKTDANKPKWTKPPSSPEATPVNEGISSPKKINEGISSPKKKIPDTVNTPPTDSPKPVIENVNEVGAGTEKFDRPKKQTGRPATQPLNTSLGSSGPTNRDRSVTPGTSAVAIGSLAAIGQLVSAKANEKKKEAPKFMVEKEKDGEYGKKKEEEVFEPVRTYTPPTGSEAAVRVIGFGAFDVAAARGGLKKAEGIAGDTHKAS